MNKVKVVAGVCVIAVVGLVLWMSQSGGGGTALNENTTNSPAQSSTLAQRVERLTTVKKRTTQLDQDIAFLLEAFEAGDGELLAQRVQELLDRDLESALAAFATLDYTFLHYRMQFPHEVVATHLEGKFSGPETMEILAEYLSTSSILTSVTEVYFDRWLERDHQGQFAWFQENSTFTDPRVISSFSQALGDSENGAAVVKMVGELPEEDVRKEYLHTKSMEFLSSAQPTEFAEYLNTLESIPEYAVPSVYNLAEQIILNETAEVSMDAARDWIGLVEDPQLKEAFTAQIGGTYLLNHPEAFDSWFESLDYGSTAEKNQLRTAIQDHHDFVRRMEGEATERAASAANLVLPFSE